MPITKINSLGITYPVSFSAGTASLPSITFSGDTNTGVYSPAADTVAFTEGGAESLRIDSSANLQFNSGYGSVATAYGCRAWVNFNGTGTVAIRGSGNVTSITDNGTGLYTINYTTAMPDVNYSVVASGRTSSIFVASGANISASSVQINTLDNSAIDNDPTHVFVAVFR